MRRFARLLIALAAVALLLAAAFTGRLDRWTDAAMPGISRQATIEQLTAIDLRAAAAYAVARGLGGVLAVTESTTAQSGLGIAGVSVDIGRVLRPAIRLVDAFSDVMIVSLISLTVQIVAVEILGAYALAWLLPIGLAALALALLLPGTAWRRLAGLLIFAALAARFALPLGVAGTAVLSDRFLRPQEDQAEQSVQLARSAMPDGGSLSFRPSEILDRIDRAVHGILTWMAVFLIEAIAMPFALTALVLLIARAILRRTLSAQPWIRADSLAVTPAKPERRLLTRPPPRQGLPGLDQP